MVQFVEGDFNNNEFSPLSSNDLDNLKHFGQVSIPVDISRMVKQVYQVRRPTKLQVMGQTSMNGLPLYELEHGVGVIVKNNTGLWLMQPSPQLMNALNTATKKH